MNKPSKLSDWVGYHVERWTLDKLRANPANTRKHGMAQLMALRKSIRAYGWTMPLLVREDGTLIAGHARLEAAVMEGLGEVPVIIARGWSDEQCAAYGIADNKIAEGGEWDMDALRGELTRLKDSGHAIDLTGFDLEDALKLTLNKPSSIDDVPKELPGASAFKDDMDLKSDLAWGIPSLRTDMLAPCPKKIRTWAGIRVTPDDGVSTYLWIWRGDSLRDTPPPERVIPCFYTDDFKFDCLFDTPHEYMARMVNYGFQVSMTPNYSLWMEQPDAAHLWATYRSRWVGRFMQECGIKVIPDISWATRKSLEFCLVGLPEEAPCLALQMQTFKSDNHAALDLDNLIETNKRLRPKHWLIYGNEPARKVVAEAGIKNVTIIATRSQLRMTARASGTMDRGDVTIEQESNDDED